MSYLAHGALRDRQMPLDASKYVVSSFDKEMCGEFSKSWLFQISFFLKFSRLNFVQQFFSFLSISLVPYLPLLVRVPHVLY